LAAANAMSDKSLETNSEIPFRGVVTGLFVTRQKKGKGVPMRSVRTSGRGFGGDYHSSFTNGRQILMISQQILNQLGLEPGSTSENIVVDGIDLLSLSQGNHLRVGGAVLEVTGSCKPCPHLDRIRPGLSAALRDRRGVFATVVSSGVICVGDTVTRLTSPHHEGLEP
jgi:MOSC domain-containing protein YiiM